MALKIGAKRKFKGLGDALVPYIAYDGYEKWPVLDKTVWDKTVPERWRWTLVDSTAVRPSWIKWTGVPEYEDLKTKKRKKAWIAKKSSLFKKLCGLNFTELDRILLREMRRLEKLWNEKEKDKWNFLPKKTI
jgi:hypothetical protein